MTNGRALLGRYCRKHLQLATRRDALDAVEDRLPSLVQPGQGGLPARLEALRDLHCTCSDL